MKKVSIALAMLIAMLMTTTRIHAQTTAPKGTAPVNLSSDLSKVPLDKLLQITQSTNTDAAGDDVTPLQVVAAFLQLQPGQVAELETLLQARQAALVPFIQQIQALVQQVDGLLNSGGNPAQIGILVLQIHAHQQQVAQTQQAFLVQFLAMLNPDQIQRIQALQIAVQLQPVLPAFRLIFLF